MGKDGRQRGGPGAQHTVVGHLKLGQQVDFDLTGCILRGERDSKQMLLLLAAERRGDCFCSQGSLSGAGRPCRESLAGVERQK